MENYEREISKLKRLVDESIDSSKAELEARLSAAERGRAEERERDRRLAADVLMKTKQVSRKGLIVRLLSDGEANVLNPAM